MAIVATPPDPESRSSSEWPPGADARRSIAAWEPDREVDVDRDGSAPDARPETDAEPPLQRTAFLPILPRCPDEHGDDDAGAEQSHHGNQDSQRNGGENGRAPQGTLSGS